MMETRIMSMPTQSQIMTGGTKVTPSVGASPYTYQNTSSQLQNAIVNGGTVTVIATSRDGSNFETVGLLAGMYLLGANDRLRITYAVAPSLTIYPL